jgi:hypothetical protein
MTTTEWWYGTCSLLPSKVRNLPSKVIINKCLYHRLLELPIYLFVLVFSLSGTNFPEVFYTNNSYGNSRNPFRRSLSICSRSGRRRADARVRLTLAHSRSSRYRGGVLKRHERSVCAKIAWASHRSRSSAVNTVVNVSGIEICRGMFTGGKTAWRGTDSRRLRARPAGPFTRLPGKMFERRSERYDGRAKDARRKARFFHFSGKKLIQTSIIYYMYIYILLLLTCLLYTHRLFLYPLSSFVYLFIIISNIYLWITHIVLTRRLWDKSPKSPDDTAGHGGWLLLVLVL